MSIGSGSREISWLNRALCLDLRFDSVGSPVTLYQVYD
jgi:hypothetical protein